MLAVNFAESTHVKADPSDRGPEFRNALDSIEQSVNEEPKSARRRSTEKSTSNRRTEEALERKRERREQDHDSLAARRKERQQAGSRTEQSDREERPAEQGEQSTHEQQGSANQQAAESKAPKQQINESSGGGFGSDPPVLEFAKAGGSGGTGQVRQGEQRKETQSQVNPGPLAFEQHAGLKGLAQGPQTNQSLIQQGGPLAAAQQPGTSQTAQSGAELAALQEGIEFPEDSSEALETTALSELTALDDEAVLRQRTEPLAGTRLGETAQRSRTQGEGQSLQSQTSSAQANDATNRSSSNPGSRSGLEAAQRGPASAEAWSEPEPLPGSVKLRGIKGARLRVATEDGQQINARLDLNDEQVDVRLAAPEGSSQLAEQRVSELRQALANHGMELGEFDVSTSSEQNAETAANEDSEPGRSSEDGQQHNNQALDRWGRPIHSEPRRGSACDGRGSLLDLHL
tara:strand:- start:3289 stop:4665 length:1377 start_codon:yes stop_codon:yes gene_type:complete